MALLSWQAFMDAVRSMLELAAAAGYLGRLCYLSLPVAVLIEPAGLRYVPAASSCLVVLQGKEVPHTCEILEMPDGSGPLFRWVMS